MPKWKTLNEVEVMTHNPDYLLVGMYVHDRELESTIHAVYGMTHSGENEGLELYYMPLHRSGTSIDCALQHYKSRRFSPDKIPNKWRGIYEQLRSCAIAVK